MAKLADAPDLGSGGAILRGSSPLPGITARQKPSTPNAKHPILNFRTVVNLTGAANAQTITVTLTNVTDVVTNTSSSVSVTMGVLLGDTNADGFVNSADITQTKSKSGQPVTLSNFREDLNLDDLINSADISFVKSMSGTALPPAAPAARLLRGRREKERQSSIVSEIETVTVSSKPSCLLLRLRDDADIRFRRLPTFRITLLSFVVGN